VNVGRKRRGDRGGELTLPHTPPPPLTPFLTHYTLSQFLLGPSSCN